MKCQNDLEEITKIINARILDEKVEIPIKSDNII